MAIVESLMIMIILLYFFFEKSRNHTHFINSLLVGLFIGLAILTKGPVGALIAGLVGFFYWAIKKDERQKHQIGLQSKSRRSLKTSLK